MAEINKQELQYTDTGQKFYPVTHVDAVVGLSDKFGAYLLTSEFNTWKNATPITIGNAQIALGGSATLTEIGVPSWAQNNALAFSDLPDLYIGTTAVQNSAAAQALEGIISIKKDTVESLFEWEPSRNAWHFHGNLYSDGSVSAGGIGSGGGGGGGATYLNDLLDVSAPSPSDGDVIVYDSNQTKPWVATHKSSFLNGYATQSWVTQQGFLTNSDLNGLATETWVTQQGFLTSSSLNNYALKAGGSDYNFLVASLKLSANNSISEGTYSLKARPKWVFLDGSSTVTKYFAYVDEIPTKLPNPQKLYFGNYTYDGSAERTINAATLGAITQSDGDARYLKLTGGTVSGYVNFVGGSAGLHGATTQENLANDNFSWSIESSGASFASLSVNGTQVNPSNYVTLTGLQTIAGIKTFKSNIRGSSNGYSPYAWIIQTSGAATFNSVTTNSSVNSPEVHTSLIDGANDALFIGNEDNGAYVNIQEDTVLLGVNLYGASTRSNGLQSTFSWQIDSQGGAEFSTLYVGGSEVTPSSYVKTSGAQTIAGYKTFTTGIITNGADIVPTTDSTDNVGHSTNRFQHGFFRNLFTSYFGFRDGSDGSKQWGHLGCGDGYCSIYLEDGQGGAYGQYVFNSTYGFFHGGNGDVPLGRSDHRWETLYAVDANLSGVVIVNGINSIDQSSSAGMSLYNYGGRTSMSFNGYGTSINLRACDSNGVTQNILAVNHGATLVGKTIRPNYNASNVNLGSNTNDGGRWSNIYGVNGNLSGDLTLASTSHIDLGPLRIEFDSNNNSLHITKASNSDTVNYGLYADGGVSAGGVGSGNPYITYMRCSQAQYNAITTKSDTTMYIIGSPVTRVYLGTALLFSN